MKPVTWVWWHTLVFSDETKIDMKYVCPRDVEKMLVQRARSVNWAAQHEQEELKEGAWIEPASNSLAKESERGLD